MRKPIPPARRLACPVDEAAALANGTLIDLSAVGLTIGGRTGKPVNRMTSDLLVKLMPIAQDRAMRRYLNDPWRHHFSERTVARELLTIIQRMHQATTDRDGDGRILTIPATSLPGPFGVRLVANPSGGYTLMLDREG